MQYVHTVAMLPQELRKVVEVLAKREDRSVSAQMRRLTLKGLEALGEWPVDKKSKLFLEDNRYENPQKKPAS